MYSKRQMWAHSVHFIGVYSICVAYYVKEHDTKQYFNVCVVSQFGFQCVSALHFLY